MQNNNNNNNNANNNNNNNGNNRGNGNGNGNGNGVRAPGQNAVAAQNFGQHQVETPEMLRQRLLTNIKDRYFVPRTANTFDLPLLSKAAIEAHRDDRRFHITTNRRIRQIFVDAGVDWPEGASLPAQPEPDIVEVVMQPEQAPQMQRPAHIDPEAWELLMGMAADEQNIDMLPHVQRNVVVPDEPSLATTWWRPFKFGKSVTLTILEVFLFRSTGTYFPLRNTDVDLDWLKLKAAQLDPTDQLMLRVYNDNRLENTIMSQAQVNDIRGWAELDEESRRVYQQTLDAFGGVLGRESSSHSALRKFIYRFFASVTQLNNKKNVIDGRYAIMNCCRVRLMQLRRDVDDVQAPPNYKRSFLAKLDSYISGTTPLQFSSLEVLGQTVRERPLKIGEEPLNFLASRYVALFCQAYQQRDVFPNKFRDMIGLLALQPVPSDPNEAVMKDLIVRNAQFFVNKFGEIAREAVAIYRGLEDPLRRNLVVRSLQERNWITVDAAQPAPFVFLNRDDLLRQREGAGQQAGNQDAQNN